jgi:hypothetical protein
MDGYAALKALWTPRCRGTASRGQRYVGTSADDGCHTRVSLAYIPSGRHVHVRTGTNPYDPMDADYFAQRRAANRAFPSLWVWPIIQ